MLGVRRMFCLRHVWWLALFYVKLCRAHNRTIPKKKKDSTSLSQFCSGQSLLCVIWRTYSITLHLFVLKSDHSWTALFECPADEVTDACTRILRTSTRELSIEVNPTILLQIGVFLDWEGTLHNRVIIHHRAAPQDNNDTLCFLVRYPHN